MDQIKRTRRKWVLSTMLLRGFHRSQVLQDSLFHGIFPDEFGDCACEVIRRISKSEHPIFGVFWFQVAYEMSKCLRIEYWWARSGWYFDACKKTQVWECPFQFHSEFLCNSWAIPIFDISAGCDNSRHLQAGNLQCWVANFAFSELFWRGFLAPSQDSQIYKNPFIKLQFLRRKKTGRFAWDFCHQKCFQTSVQRRPRHHL